MTYLGVEEVPCDVTMERWIVRSRAHVEDSGERSLIVAWSAAGDDRVLCEEIWAIAGAGVGVGHSDAGEEDAQDEDEEHGDDTWRLSMPREFVLTISLDSPVKCLCRLSWSSCRVA